MLPARAAQKDTTNVRAWLPLSIAASLGFAVFAIRLLVADHALAVTQGRMDSGNPGAAAESYRTTLRWKPAGASADLYYSRGMSNLAARTQVFAIQLSASQQAFEAGVRAASTSEDRQNAWYNLAELFARQNDPVDMERSLRTAIAWAPNWFKPHWSLAQLLEIAGRHDEAVSRSGRCHGTGRRQGPRSLRHLEPATTEALKFHNLFTSRPRTQPEG